MCRRNRIHPSKRSYISLIIAILTFFSLNISVYATIPNTRYTELVDEPTTGTGVIDPNNPVEEPEEPAKSKEEIDVSYFNGSFLDTVLYIIGGISLAAMLLEIIVFVVCKMYPSCNSLLEKLNKIGIDGIADGYVLAFVKLMLPGIFSFLCLTGYLKQIIGLILSWFINIGGLS